MIDAGKLLDQIAFDGKSPKAGDYVRAQRKILGFTLEDLAEITNIDKANLCSYENNKKEIGLKVAIKLGAALNLDPKIIIETTNETLLESPEMKVIKSKSKKMRRSKNQTVA